MEPRAGTSVGPVEASSVDAQPLAASHAEAAPAPPLRGSAHDDALSEFPTEEEVHASTLAASRHRDARGFDHPAGESPWSRIRGIALVGLVLLAVLAVAAWRWAAPGRPAAAPAAGTISVETSPPGALLLVDGRERGRTPLSLAVAPGTHQLLLQLGDISRPLSVSVAAGAQIVHHVELAVATSVGRLRVVSTPAGAPVVFDGAARGVTPLELASIAAGDHEITVGGGAGAVTQHVAVPAGGLASVVVPLGESAKATPGWISVESPIELQVYEGDALVGSSRSQRIMVLSGRHDLRLSNPSLGFEATRSVQVAPERVATVRIAVPNGVLSVNAVPWAEVILDGRTIGETPIANIAVPIGEHDLVLRNPKFPELRRPVVVTATAPARVGVDLRK